MKQFKQLRLAALALMLLMCLSLLSCSKNEGELNYDFHVRITQGGGFDVSANSCKVMDIGTFEGSELIIPSTQRFQDKAVELFKYYLERKKYDYIKEISSELVDLYFSQRTVTEIADGAFENCTQLESVMMPDTITEIGDRTFAQCNNLKQIELSESIVSVGAGAFNGCPDELFVEYEGALYIGCQENPYLVLVRVSSVEITCANIHEDTKVIADDAFAGCQALTELSAPKGLTNIPENAFDSCVNLQKVQLPEAQGLEFVLNSDGESYSVSGLGTCEMLYFAIPKEYEGLPVTGIADGALGYSEEEYAEESKQYKKFLKQKKSEGMTDTEKMRQMYLEEYGIRFFEIEAIAGIEMISLHDGIVSIGENAFENVKTYPSN